MKKIFLLACLVVSAAIYSQELDEAYLQSLPEGVREDVLNKIEAKDDLDKLNNSINNCKKIFNLK